MFIDSGLDMVFHPSGVDCRRHQAFGSAGAGNCTFHRIYKHFAPGGASSAKTLFPHDGLSFVKCGQDLASLWRERWRHFGHESMNSKAVNQRTPQISCLHQS